MTNSIIFNTDNMSTPDTFIGQPLYHYDQANCRTGYIAGINNDKLIVVWETGTIDRHARASMYDRLILAAIDANIKAKTIAEVEQLIVETQAKLDIEEQDREQKRLALKVQRDVLLNQLRKTMPASAKAVIYANRQVNTSDTQSDYHGHKNEETILLAWSSHTRDLFPEMRKAALNHDSTASLKTEGIEHREKYSMGDGYYLSVGHSDSTGWVIRKQKLSFDKNPTIDQKLDGVPTGFNAIK